MATYGSFPGVQVTTVSGGISSVAIGEEEKLVIFGEAAYADDAGGDGNTDSLSGSAGSNSPEQINARREANDKFTDGSELAEAMKEALANGANIDYLYGVAVDRYEVVDEQPSTQTGTLSNAPIFEDTSLITWEDDDAGPTEFTVEFHYGDGSGNSAPPSASGETETVYLNPITGEYDASAAPNTSNFNVDYKYLDYSTAFGTSAVQAVVEEDETGVYVALSESDTVSSSLQSEISTLRNNYQLVNGLTPAEPNADSSESPPDAHYNTSQYSNANQSITEEYFYKFAPVRKEDDTATVMGGVAGLFAGNPITNPIYNEALSGYSALEQTFSKSDADNMRGEDIIPIRDAGSIRVKGNRSTAYSSASTVAADFWTRRITDRVILIGKTIGDNTIGKINDPDTRSAATRQIEAEMRSLVQDRLIRANTSDTTNWTVDVYEDSTNDDEVNIDISFTPYGIVKQVDETITVDTS